MNPLTIDSLRVIDGEPRVLDTVLATHLGYANARQIRELIKRNAIELRSFGGLSYGTTNPGANGRPGAETYLNEAQALLICMFARSPQAAQVRKTLIDVFMAWRAGKTVPVAAHHRKPPQTAPSPVADPVPSFTVDLAWSDGAERYWIDFQQDNPADPVFVEMCLPLNIAIGLAARAVAARADLLPS